MSSVDAIRQSLRNHVNPERAVVAPRFFKAGPGEYAEGDMFIGVTVPDTRKIARQNRTLPLAEVQTLLRSPWHEERLLALFIAVDQFNQGDTAVQQSIYKLYLANTAHINNWDLVDSSASYIVGAHIADRADRLEVLEHLAKSDLLWERRIAMISTLYFIVKRGRADETLVIADILLGDSHDLIQKAVGWMLREVGKRIDRKLLEDYLDIHAATMPRTTLRYAIEHFPPQQRQDYLQKKFAAQ